MIYINIFVIHTDELVFRKNYVVKALKTIEDICKNNSYGFNTFIMKESKDVTVEMKKTEDIDFDNKIVSLDDCHKSNFSKQYQAIQKIVELSKTEKEGDTHYYMCMEDDCVFLPQFVANLQTFLENPKICEWDILLLCVCQPNEMEELLYRNTRDLFKMLPSKECYMITGKTAEKLLPDLEKMNCQFRVQFSYWIYTHPEIVSKYPTKRISIEGSKIGIMPSSVNNNNVLIYNRDYLKLFNMVLGKESFDIEEATKVFKSSSHLKSPDIMHLYAVLLFKNERLCEAKEMFLEAVKESAAKNGKLQKNTEMLNNAINICGLYQPDRDLYRKTPSKYELKN